MSYAVAGVPNDVMGEGPIPASKLALKKLASPSTRWMWSSQTEAFASQALTVTKGLGLNQQDQSRMVVRSRLAIRLARPGAVIATKALYELQRVSSKYAGHHVYRRRSRHRRRVRTPLGVWHLGERQCQFDCRRQTTGSVHLPVFIGPGAARRFWW